MKTSVLPGGALLNHNEGEGGTILSFLSGAVQQLKLLPRVNTSHFLRPRVDISPLVILMALKQTNKMKLA